MGSNGRNGNRGHLEIVPFEVDSSTTVGFMVFPGAPPTELEVERTAENDHLFMHNTVTDRFEVLRYGSALIVNLLRMYDEPASSAAPEERPTLSDQHELALFDTKGSFHDHLLLREPLFPREADSGAPRVKHTAFFDKIIDSKKWPFTIAVDDIYMLSLAKPLSA
jgi:hypothetical protein